MISVVIPAINESKQLPRLISKLQSLTHADSLEILIADGGSEDDSEQIVQSLGAKYISCPEKGRSRQMNFGASKARYELLYFLHADTLPPESLVGDITHAVNEGFGAGCYRLGFDDSHPILRFYAWFTKFDVDLFRFGDQSLFVSKKVFEEIGGFDEELMLMEDQIIVRKIKHKTSFKIMNGRAITSARKYRKVGIIKLQLIFSCVLLMFYINVDQQKIVNFYLHQID